MKSSHIFANLEENEPDMISLPINIFDRIVSLGSLKAWLREVTTEVILEFLTILLKAIGSDLVEQNDGLKLLKSCLLRLAPLIPESMENISAWQIMLQIGLQNLAISSEIFRDLLKEADLLDEEKAFSITTIELASDTLLTATAGFPKVSALHTVDTLAISNLLDSCIECGTSLSVSFSHSTQSESFKLQGKGFFSLSI